MGDSFAVDLNRLSGAGKKVSATAATVAGVQGKVSAARLPAISWGLLGQPVAALAYHPMLDDFTRFLQQLHEGVGHVGEHLDGCAEQYRAIDEQVTQTLKQLMDHLDGGK